MNTASTPGNPSVYQQPGLPTIAPANSFSPTTAREPLLTSSFQTPMPQTAGSPQQYATAQQQQQFMQDSRYPAGPTHSSPIHTHTPMSGPTIHHPIQSRSASFSQSAPVTVHPAEQNGYRASSGSITTMGQPARPSAPYQQFCEHMRPQLEADNYPREHIQSRIDEEWRKLSVENRGLWEDRYQEQMKEYEDQMDVWKRAQRATHTGPGGGSFSRR